MCEADNHQASIEKELTEDDRILITEDKDFGQLVYSGVRRTGGVIFIRFPARVRRNLAETVV